MPSAIARSYKVGWDCHMVGSTRSSHLRAFSNRPGSPLRGTRMVYPSIPCIPGMTPVPKVASAVAVVDGKVEERVDD